ncbi:MAG: PKD domain-containing protein, partial [Holophagales bacterium]|nr:PKD domain-containing protein [Holophagales bacterium]
VTSRQWDFGDGATSTRQSPAHTFPEPGYYAVTLRAGNSVGSDEVTRLIWVGAGRAQSE